MPVRVKIDNAYEDGHESTHHVVLATPTASLADIDEWFADVVFEHIGDGHGASGLGSCYEATIVQADDRPELVGTSYEWRPLCHAREEATHVSNGETEIELVAQIMAACDGDPQAAMDAIARVYGIEAARVEVVGYRDPDYETEIAVFVNGVRVEPETTIADPGAGYSLSEWRESGEDFAAQASSAAAEKIREYWACGEQSKYVEDDDETQRRVR